MLIWKSEKQARNEYPTEAFSPYSEAKTSNNSQQWAQDCKYNGNLKSSWVSIYYSYFVSRNTIFTSDWYPRNIICLTPGYLFIHEKSCSSAWRWSGCPVKWNRCVSMPCTGCQTVTLYLKFLRWCIFTQSYGQINSLLMLVKEWSKKLLSPPLSSDSFMAGILLTDKYNQQYFKHIFLVLTAKKSNAELRSTPHTLACLNSALILLLEQKTKACLQLSEMFIICKKGKQGNVNCRYLWPAALQAN